MIEIKRNGNGYTATEGDKVVASCRFSLLPDTLVIEEIRADTLSMYDGMFRTVADYGIQEHKLLLQLAPDVDAKPLEILGIWPLLNNPDRTCRIIQLFLQRRCDGCSMEQ